MKQHFLFCASLLTTILFHAGSLTAQTPVPMGFTGDHGTRQLALEKKFDAGLSAAEMDAWMKRLTARPHHTGSPYDKANALFLDSLFRQWGYQSRIDTYYVMFPTPKIRQLELLSPTHYKAVLREKVIPTDPYTKQTAEQLPPYNAYSADGDVTAGLVFVNYGLADDYEKLAAMGVSVKGKIAIVKYGHSWRGIKPRLAYEHGAVGCLIYSDPGDDGYSRGDVYPKGAFKNPSAVQRGSVTNMTIYPGDPLTPGHAATRDAKRLKLNETKVIKKIPVLPISYEDAQPLLQAMGGPVAPSGWAGGLPITYHVGDNDVKVHLKLAFNWDLTPIYDVIATMAGSVYPDQWILRGNHHDAWVNGAADPVSGLVAELGEAKAIGLLAGTGWKPKRTIVFCAWDAEEPALLGSTEWVEDHADELKEKAVAYINSDNNGRGFLYAGGSHSLEAFFSQIAFGVSDPETGISVGQRSLDRSEVLSHKPAGAFKIGALGSGSDYSPFLQHLGIASMNLGFGGEDEGGEYHTMYDDYIFFKKYKDPGFTYEVSLAQVAGRTVLRLANADILPFDFTHLHKTIAEYADQVRQLAGDMREETNFENRIIGDSTYARVQDPTRELVVPKPKQAVPYFNFAPLQNALASLGKSAADYQHMIDSLEQHPNEALISRLNGMVYKSERYLTSEEGLPGRPWYIHLIYAPGYYTGYGVKTLPGVREAIEQRQFDRVEPEINLLGKTLDKFSTFVEQMAAIGK